MSRADQDAAVVRQAAQQIAYNAAKEQEREMPEAMRPTHSPLGASGAERWLNCPGSVTLLKHLDLDESEEPDYRREGTAMHEAAAHALINGLDAWELVGETFFDTPMTPELCNPLQIYLDYCRTLKGERYIEYAISSPVHPQFYGTADFGCYGATLEVVDLKGGMGIMVEADHNPQLMYYAFGFIDGLERRSGGLIPEDTEVKLTICQPRGFHSDGPIRSWVSTVWAIKTWVHEKLVPAMQATEFEDRLTPGDWCRFCPAKLACPVLTDLFKAAALSNPKHLPDTSDAALGENYRLADGVKYYLKALEAEAFARRMRGRLVPHTKLVQKKANRVWKDGAALLAEQRFGPAAFNEPSLKSPAEMEKVPEASPWVKEFAYTPNTGLTLALDTDSRQEVMVTDPAARFADVDKAAADW